MLRTTLNLARKPAENLRRVRMIWGGSLIVLVAVLVALSSVAMVQWLGSRPIQLRTDALRRQMAPLAARAARDPDPVSDPRTRATIAQAKFLNQLIARKSISWTMLFQQLEQIVPPGVELVSLHPLVRNGANAVDIRFVSHELKPAITFVQNLESSGDFTGAQVERETETTPGAAATPVASSAPRYHLEVTAQYTGESQ